MEEKVKKTGFVHVYAGDGKGKTTAAAGLAVRAAGRGMRVVFAQFMKGRESGEAVEFNKIPEIEVLRADKDYGFYRNMTDEEKLLQKKAHDKITERIFERVYKLKDVDMVVLDELAWAYRYGLIDKTGITELLKNHEGVEIVITGRNPSEELLEAADYITEMKKVKHPYESGVAAREGIEY